MGMITALVTTIVLITVWQGNSRAETAEGHEVGECTVTSRILEHEFSVLAKNVGLLDNNGRSCVIDHVTTFSYDEFEVSNVTCSMWHCETVYDFVESLILQLNLTSICCLQKNESNCTNTRERPDAARAYGYGFLMVMLVSATSVLGILIVPLVKGNRCGQLYKYVYALMISLGASALFCDAVLHLIPEAFEIHSHADAVHSYHNDGKLYLWKGSAIAGGMYIFFLLEVFLHAWSNQYHYGHDHGKNTQQKSSNSEDSLDLTDSLNHEPAIITDGASKSSGCSYGTVPDAGEPSSANDLTKVGRCIHVYYYLLNMKPLAWIIVIGDALHNFADGLALGAAISQSLALGISTTIALVFHEIPHELGDFAILLSTGMHWGVALLFNVLSSVTAIAGFFIGVTVGTESQEANGWILAVTAGIFLYIALVDLLPVLIHSKEKGCVRCGVFVVSNIGFALSFGVLLVIALYEDELNTLVQ